MSNPKTLTIKFYADPGHGWGCVKLSTLREMQVVGDISHYSFVKGKSIYLEEDCDLNKLVQKAKSFGYEIVYVEKHTNKQSPIRSYPRATQENIMKAFQNV